MTQRNMIITTRQATIEDYKEILRLYNGLVGDNRYTLSKEDSFERVLLSPNNFIYVAEKEGKLVGVISFSVRDVVRHPQPILEIDDLFVVEKLRKQGTGRRLMEQMEEVARSLECCRILVESGYKYKEGHVFYTKLGYKKEGYYFKKILY